MLARFFVNFLLRPGVLLGLGLFLSGASSWAQTPTETEVDKLLANDGAAGDEFGFSASVSGDTAVIGARLDNDNGSDSGSAYVFIRDDEGEWSQQAKLLADDGAAGDEFGFSVALDGDTVVIGARLDNDSGSDAGSAYVFIRESDEENGEESEGEWSQQAKLLADDGAAGDQFGFSVDLDADTALIGARLDNDNGSDAGSAYVFIRDSDEESEGEWSQQAKLLADDGAAGDQFGFSVDLDGDTALIGAPLDNDNGSNSGSAYVFVQNSDEENGDEWEEQTKLLTSDGVAGDVFGAWVSIDRDTAVIGAALDNDNGSDAGSAYVFARNSDEENDDEWQEQTKLLASDGTAGDIFGAAGSIVVEDSTAVITSRRDNDNGSNSGSAYVFSLGESEIENP